MHSDSKKRRSFVALLFTAGDVKRWQEEQEEEHVEKCRSEQ